MTKAKCKNCRNIVESKHRHDFVSCSCRVKSNKLTEQLIEALGRLKDEHGKLDEHLIYCAFEEVIGHGFSLDGGNDYTRVIGKLSDYEEVN